MEGFITFIIIAYLILALMAIAGVLLTYWSIWKIHQIIKELNERENDIYYTNLLDH